MSEDKKQINLINVDSLKTQLEIFEKIFENDEVKDYKYYKKVVIMQASFETAIKQCEYLQKVISDISESNKEQNNNSSSN